MAVPKKKTSKSRRNMRRAHHVSAMGKINYTFSESGNYQLRHHMCLGDGTYRNRDVIVSNDVSQEQEAN